MKTNDKKKAFISLASINQVVESNIVLPVEKELRNQEFVEWGTNNSYPQYLHSLYLSCPTLQAIINGVADYTVGNGVKSLNQIVLQDKDVNEIVRDMAMSYAIYGGIALNVLRNKLGQICKIVPVDFKAIRSDKDNTWFYYSEDFGNKSYGRGKYIKYPAFDKNDKTQYSSIFYYKATKHTTYPVPLYSASVNSAECEKQISIFHLNSIVNGFSSNILVSMNNGMPSPEIQSEIEDAFTEKFTGGENASRPLIVYNQDKEHSVEIQKIETDSFADRYEALSKKVQMDLFTAFRCNANLMGIPTESNGFNSEEYNSSFKLFNRMTIRPIQMVICSSLKEILGEDAITITPFNLDEE